MLKSGFRGERKGNPHPVPLPRRGGNVVTEKGISKIENLEISKFVRGVLGEYGDGKLFL